MTTPTLRNAPALLLAMLLAGCSSVPEHPPLPMPDNWYGRQVTHPADVQALARWWQQFDDPHLSRLVERAMQHNLDAQLAEQRITAARAQLRQARAGLLPSLDLPGSASRQWIDNDQQVAADSPLAGLGLDDDIRFDNWELALQATWDLDLFGATRARRDSARAQVRSAEAQAIGVRLTVAANAAQGYIQLRALQARQAQLAQGLEIATEQKRVADALFRAGAVTRLDVEASAAEQAVLVAEQASVALDLNTTALALDTLLAQQPGSTARHLAPPAPVPMARAAIPAGQPLDLLRRRPDMLAAAARLRGADLQALAARRDLLPKLALQAAVGRSGMALNDYSSASNFSRIGATFGLPLLDFPRRGAAIEQADVEGAGAYLSMRQTLLVALEDVERGLAQVEGQGRRLTALKRTLAHRERAHALAQRSYQLGQANLADALDAQRGALQARQQVLQGQAALATAQVALFLALGGGWQSEPESTTQADNS